MKLLNFKQKLSLKINLKILFTVFSFNLICTDSSSSSIKIKPADNSCDKVVTLKEDRFFWNSDKQELENLNQIFTLFNQSLKLKITCELFKVTLESLNFKIKSIKSNIKSKNKLQKNLEVIISNLSKFSQQSSNSNKKIRDLIELLNQISSKK